MLRIAYLLLSAMLVSASTGLEPDLGSAAPTASSPAPPGREIIRVTKSPDGLFYLTLEINGRPVRFLVDTGATVVMMRGADAARAGIIGERPGAMRTAGGTQHIRWGSATQVVLTGNDYGAIDVAIADSGLPASLLGQTFLSRLGTVTIEGETMIVSEPGELS